MKHASRYSLLFRSILIAAAAICVSLPSWAQSRLGSSDESLVVDFNPDNGRSDIRTESAKNWSITSGKQELTSDFGARRVTVRAVAKDGPANLAWGWWKAGYDFGATLSSDGLTTELPGVQIELQIDGLSPGKHRLVTWHNAWDEKVHAGELSLTLNVASPQLPQLCGRSLQVAHDDLAASCSFEFELQTVESIVLRIAPDNPESFAILNGFALDIPNPQRIVRQPSPTDGDEHVISRPILQWLQPQISDSNRSRIEASKSDSDASTKLTQSVARYHLYLGNDSTKVQSAGRDSSEYVGSTLELRWPTEIVDFMCDTFWRVDCEFADGSVSKGRVFRFRIRHDAFVGAEGYGRFAIGGRGGRVIPVTNLNDSGPGSLREAVESEGPRTVVFQTGGTIHLKSKLLIKKPYITIAGQTAPGDGICVRGYTFGCFGTHDVIMRHVRLRVGDESGSTMDGTGFASSDHCIFDHCSISWSIDEAVSSRSAKNITLQRCIVAEALNVANHQKYKQGTGHSFAGSISGDIGSFHHNLLAHCAGRNWSLAGGLNRGGKFAGRLDIRNNVVYNWQHRTNDGGVKALNLVNNLYIPGPASKVFHLLKPDAGSPTDPQQYFVSGNRMEGKFDETSDNWLTCVTIDAKLLDQIKLDQPFCEPLVETTSLDDLLENVLSDVGANCQGLDQVDIRVLSDVRNRTASSKGSKTGLPGIIDSQTDVGGWPELRSGQTPLDSDQDGMPDAWETAHGLNPMKQDHNQQLSNSDVTAIELYLAELANLRRTQ